MGITRRIIFPAIRILIWAVIAVALVVIAFGSATPDGAAEGEHFEPGANFSDALITPTSGDIDNRVTLTGKITPDDAFKVKAETSGTVYRLWVSSGDTVEQGAPLVVLKQLLGDGEDDNLFTTTTVWASASGTVTIDVEHGAEVTAGDVVAKVSSGTFVVDIDVEPHQLYQLIDAPGTAKVKITNGPPDFECTNFTTRVVDGEEGVSTQGRCVVPGDVLVFPGLAATVEVITDSAQNALLLPITAVEGTVGTGKVWHRDDAGELASIDVTLGLTDGKLIEIVSGLSEGDEVLEFVPSLENPGGPGWDGPGIGWEEEYLEEDWVDGEEIIEE